MTAKYNIAHMARPSKSEGLGRERSSAYVAHYNLCRVHEALRVTPGMQVGVTDHIWTISELVTAVLDGVTPEPQGRKAGPFTVIDGGLI